MNSIELIRGNLHRSMGLVLRRVEEMSDHCFVFPTPNGGAHTIWTLGHLAVIEGQVIHEFALGTANPLASWLEPFDGDDVSGDREKYPPFSDVLAKCREMRELTLSHLDRLSEQDLDTISAACPKTVEDTFGTYRLCFQFVADHWYMHRGQLADARRTAHLERMWF